MGRLYPEWMEMHGRMAADGLSSSASDALAPAARQSCSSRPGLARQSGVRPTWFERPSNARCHDLSRQEAPGSRADPV
jgi:hypothetical protein